MNSYKASFLTVFSILLGSLFIFSCSKTTEKETTGLSLYVGVSKAQINPEMGSYIAGDAQNRVFTGILDSLYAKAVVIFDGESSLALVTVDCIGLMYPDLIKVRNELSKMDFPIPFTPESLIISSTHTHSGPDVVGLWGKDYSQSGVSSQYQEFLIKTISDQIFLAAQQLTPVQASYAETNHHLPWVENIADKEIDRTVTSIQFKDDEDRNIVTLTNFACHPTYLDAVVSEVSADYPAGFYKKMEETLHGEHLFLQGAIGGWIQPNNKDGQHNTALASGESLADIVIKALTERSRPLKGSKIQFRKNYVDFEVVNETWKLLAASGLIDREVDETVNSEIAWFSIGEAHFATHPGETAPFYSLETKKLMPDGPKFVLGLSQDALGYINKPEMFDNPDLPHADYLTRMSLGKNTAPKMMEILRKLSNAQ